MDAYAYPYADRYADGNAYGNSDSDPHGDAYRNPYRGHRLHHALRERDDARRGKRSRRHRRRRNLSFRPAADLPPLATEGLRRLAGPHAPLVAEHRLRPGWSADVPPRRRLGRRRERNLAGDHGHLGRSPYADLHAYARAHARREPRAHRHAYPNPNRDANAYSYSDPNSNPHRDARAVVRDAIHAQGRRADRAGARAHAHRLQMARRLQHRLPLHLLQRRLLRAPHPNP